MESVAGELHTLKDLHKKTSRNPPPSLMGKVLRCLKGLWGTRSRMLRSKVAADPKPMVSSSSLVGIQGFK